MLVRCRKAIRGILISAAALYPLAPVISHSDLDLHRLGFVALAKVAECDVAMPSKATATTIVTVLGPLVAHAIAKTDGTVPRARPGFVEFQFPRDSKTLENRA
jgi:hypothetical protein